MKYIQKLAIFMILLILSTTVVMAVQERASSVQASDDFGDGKNYHSGVNTGDLSGGNEFGNDSVAEADTQTFEDYEQELPQGAPDMGDVKDAGQQCIEKHEETSALVDALGGETLSTVTMVYRMLKGACKVLSMIEMVMAGIGTIAGSPPCCLIGANVWPPALTICEGYQYIYAWWEALYRPVGGGFCCMVNCNWCKGQDCLKNMVDSQKINAQNEAASDQAFADAYGDNAIRGTGAGELNNIRDQNGNINYNKKDGTLKDSSGNPVKDKNENNIKLNKEQQKNADKSNKMAKRSREKSAKAAAKKSNVGMGGKITTGIFSGGGMFIYNGVLSGMTEWAQGVPAGSRSNWFTGSGDGSRANVITGKNAGSGGSVISDFMGTFGFDPYESIYVSGLCFCLPGILFNVEKLKAIYKSYDCCIEQACTNGISTEPCEKMLAEATCMYWEGSALSAVLKVVMGIVSGLVAQGVMLLIKAVGLSWVGCLVPLWSLKDLPDMMKGLGDTFDTDTIDDVSCKDLGFGKLKESINNAENGAKRALANNEAGEINEFEARDLDGNGVIDTAGIFGSGLNDTNGTNYTHAGILYLDEKSNMKYYSVETGTKNAELEDLENKFLFIENDGNYEKYDMTGSKMIYENKSNINEPGYLEKDGVRYDFSPDTKGNLIVVKTATDGTKEVDSFKAAIDPQLLRNLNNLAKEQSKDLRELVTEVTKGDDQIDYSGVRFPPYYYNAQRPVVDYRIVDSYSDLDEKFKGVAYVGGHKIDTTSSDKVTFDGVNIGKRDDISEISGDKVSYTTKTNYVVVKPQLIVSKEVKVNGKKQIRYFVGEPKKNSESYESEKEAKAAFEKKNSQTKIIPVLLKLGKDDTFEGGKISIKDGPQDVSIKNYIKTKNAIKANGWSLNKGTVLGKNGEKGKLTIPDGGNPVIKFDKALSDGTVKVNIGENGQTTHETNILAEEQGGGYTPEGDAEISDKNMKIVKTNGAINYFEYESTNDVSDGATVRIMASQEQQGVRIYQFSGDGFNNNGVTVKRIAQERGWLSGGTASGDPNYEVTIDGETAIYNSDEGVWKNSDGTKYTEDTTEFDKAKAAVDGGGITNAGADEMRNRRASNGWSLAQLIGIDQGSKDDYVSHLAAMESRMAEEAAYGIAWAAVSQTLGKWGQEWIQDYCKAEYDASEPMNDKPQKINSRGPGADPNTEKCMGEAITIATTQILDKFKYVNEAYKYEYMYSVTACNKNVDFTVSLRNEYDEEFDVLIGNVTLGQAKASDESVELPNNYNEICIISSDTQKLCVPYNGNVTQLNITGGNFTNTTNATEASCQDEFNVVITRSNNNYKWLYEVKQCEPDRYTIAFANHQKYDSESTVDDYFGSRAYSGVFQSDKNYTEMCYITTNTTICKDFANTITGTGNGTGIQNQTTTTTQFDKTITKTPNGNLFDYDIAYRIIPNETITFSTYLTKDNLIMDLETNKLISETHDFKLTKTTENYTEFCIDTSDETFGEDGLLCENIE